MPPPRKPLKVFFAGNTGMVRLERLVVERGVRKRLLAFPVAEKNFELGYKPAYDERVKK